MIGIPPYLCIRCPDAGHMERASSSLRPRDRTGQYSARLLLLLSILIGQGRFSWGVYFPVCFQFIPKNNLLFYLILFHSINFGSELCWPLFFFR